LQYQQPDWSAALNENGVVGARWSAQYGVQSHGCWFDHGRGVVAESARNADESVGVE
jgi:hypothetical protein